MLQKQYQYGKWKIQYPVVDWVLRQHCLFWLILVAWLWILPHHGYCSLRLNNKMRVYSVSMICPTSLSPISVFMNDTWVIWCGPTLATQQRNDIRNDIRNAWTLTPWSYSVKTTEWDMVCYPITLPMPTSLEIFLISIWEQFGDDKKVIRVLRTCVIHLNTKSSSYLNSPHFQALYSNKLTHTFHYITFFPPYI